jgi:hypothetical protein
MARFYALLIGINCYLPNKLSNGLYYKSLNGCVRDVLRLEDFLRTRLDVPGEQIIKLTSSNSETGKPLEPPAQWPTYENIVKAFRQLEELSQPGDQVYIHYSGHGGRTHTTPAFHHVKGAKGIDEVLVPMDLGDSEGRYLRDTELQYLLKRMVDRGLIVTIVLDSCHAGGATRRPKPILNPELHDVRGVGEIDHTPRLCESLVAPPDQLVKTWQELKGKSIRAAEADSGWLQEPQGYVLLAACRANEYANERVYEGTEKSGAMSYWLIDSLKQLGPGFTYEMLHRRVLGKVHADYSEQTPQLQGEGDRIVFGTEKAPLQEAVTVINTDSNGTLILNAGQAHGVRRGSKFSIYTLYATDLTRIDDRIAIVEVTDSGAVNSTAKVLTTFGTQTVQSGCAAVLFDPGAIRLRRRVRLETNGEIPEAMFSDARRNVEQQLALRGDSFVSLAGADEPADYRVTITEKGVFVICDPAGDRIPNLRPEIRVADQDATTRLVDRLVHLAKYANIRALDNNSSQSLLARALLVEFADAPVNFELGDQIKPAPVPAGQILTLNSGEWCFLRIKNLHSEALNITVFDLQPDWGITQIYPTGSSAFELVDPGNELVLPLHMTLPPDYESGTDIIKIFATLETTSFRWFELPALDRQEEFRGVPATSLEEFLSCFSAETSASRHAFVPVWVNAEWTTHQLEVEIRRPSRARQFVSAMALEPVEDHYQG